MSPSFSTQQEPGVLPCVIGSPKGDNQIQGGGSATPVNRKSKPHRTRTTRRRKALPHGVPRPRQQGDIDGLCGFYAVLNALRLALAPWGGLSPEQEHVIWTRIVRFADRKWRFAKLFLGGTHTYQFLAIARYAVKLAQGITGKPIVLRPLLRRDVQACGLALDAVLTNLAAKGHVAILAGIDNEDTSHWTVITGMTRATLRVLDSDGYHYLKLEGCKLAQRRRAKGSPRYWVRVYGGLVIVSPSLSDQREATSAKRAIPSRKSLRRAPQR